MASNSNYLANSLRRKMLNSIASPKGRASGSPGASGEASLEDISSGVNPGTVFARQRFAQQLSAQADADMKNQAALSLADEKGANTAALQDQRGQARLAEDNLKQQFTGENDRHKALQKIEYARQMQRMGFSPMGQALASRSGKPVGGYKPGDEIPTDTNGLPLQSVEMRDSGFLTPKYGRSKKAEDELGTAEAESMKDKSAIENENLKKTYAQQQAANEPGILQKMGRFFNNDPSKSVTQPAQSDYDNMSEDELYDAAQKGDQKAIQIGKQKFGGK